MVSLSNHEWPVLFRCRFFKVFHANKVTFGGRGAVGSECVLLPPARPVVGGGWSDRAERRGPPQRDADHRRRAVRGRRVGAQASGTTDVFTAVSRDGGRRFGAPVRVNDIDGDARLNGEQPPHIALVPRTGREPLTGAGTGVYPSIALAGDAVVAAWTSVASTSIQVQRLAGSARTGTGQ